MKIVKLTVFVESNEHDGCCYCADCEYDVYTADIDVPLPKEYQDYDVGCDIFENYKYWEPKLKAECPDLYGFYYTGCDRVCCDPGKEGPARGLDRHFRRATVTDATVIEKKYAFK